MMDGTKKRSKQVLRAPQDAVPEAPEPIPPRER